MDNAQQLAQLLSQGQPQEQSQNPMEWLKSFITPNTPAGALANQDPYNAYVLEALDRGENPIPRIQFLQQMRSNNGL